LTGYRQNLALGLFRSDYMVHQDQGELQIKQVEFNTIASSFGGLSVQTSLLHKYSLPLTRLCSCRH
jgi:glutathione synthase